MQYTQIRDYIIDGHGRYLFGSIALVALFVAFIAPEPKQIIVIASVTSLILASIFYKREITEQIAVAFPLALFIVAYNPHIYTTSDIYIGHISVFAFVSWTAGLVVLREAYELYPWKFRWVVIPIAYVIALLSLEYIGYHLLDIRLVGDDPSFFGLGVLHGPISMHIIYMLAGPAYLWLTDFVRVK
jgi:hypothetical protein